MGNAAQVPFAAAGAEKMRIRYRTEDGFFTVECGTYTYERAPDRGPFILQFLRDADRQSATNEPIGVATGVTEWWVNQPEPVAEGEAPLN